MARGKAAEVAASIPSALEVDGEGKGGRSSGGRAGGVGDPVTSDSPWRRPARVHLKLRCAGEKRGTHQRHALEWRHGRWVVGGEGGALRAAARAFGTFRSNGWWLKEHGCPHVWFW